MLFYMNKLALSRPLINNNYLFLLLYSHTCVHPPFAAIKQQYHHDDGVDGLPLNQ